MRSDRYVLIHRQNEAVASDDERPPPREAAWPEDAVRTRRVFRRIAQDRISHAERVRERTVGVGCVDARREILDVELPKLRIARPERPAFDRSTAGERFRKPCQHDGRMVAVVDQPVNAAVRPRERK